MDNAYYDDAERLRSRQALADDESTLGHPAAGMGAPSIVGNVVTGGGAARRFYTITPQYVTGVEAEGSPGVLTPATGGNFQALNLGQTAPAGGATVLCTFVDYRWVFRYD